jgi:CBS domain-containing protein
MSPRAAWQLEAMRYSDVYDFGGGKIEWIVHGLPTEGTGPHHAVVGEVADRDAVIACPAGTAVEETAGQLESVPHDYCVVVNDRDIVLGRMRKKNVAGQAGVSVEEVMEPGPSTVRPSEPAKGLLERMKKRGVPAVIVTTAKGRLVGVVTQGRLEDLLARSERLDTR